MADKHNSPVDTTIDVGRMRKRVSLLNPADGADASGKPLPSTQFAQRWASVEPSAGLAMEMAKQFTTETAYTVVMRWLDGVGPKITLQLAARTFQILAVLNVREENSKLVLLCREYL